MKLIYFDLNARASFIRALLFHAKVEFEDVRISFEEFYGGKKEELKPEFGQLPLLVLDDGTVLSQSYSIARYLGKTYGYYPEDASEAYLVDNAVDGMTDFYKGLIPMLETKDEEAKKEIFGKWVAGDYPRILAIYENKLEKNGNNKHFVGDKWTIADFVVGGVFFNLIYNEGNPGSAFIKPILESQFPRLKEYCENWGKELEEHLKSRPVRPF